MSLKLKLLTYTSLLTLFLSGCEDAQRSEDDSEVAKP